MNKKKFRIVTHSGPFHTDDVFAVAALLLIYGEENCEVYRSRDPELLKTADVAVDTGNEYNPAKNIFDHHQKGRAGTRENGIPYASFGLVWKHFGERLCPDIAARGVVEERLVMPIDSQDNGHVPYSKSLLGIYPYSIDQLVHGFVPDSAPDDAVTLAAFLEVVQIAKKIIQHEIRRAERVAGDIPKVEEAYRRAKDKRIIELDEKTAWRSILTKYPEPLLVVYPRLLDVEKNRWGVTVVQDGYPHAFNSRIHLPAPWAGKSGKELADVTGVPDAVFCHDGRFMCAANSREGALKLAELALNAAS